MHMPGFAFLGFRRGGSSIAFMILQHLLLNSGLKSEDVVAIYHEKGIKIDDIPLSALMEAFTHNHMVGCFRQRPQALEKITNCDISPILVIRDPRDCQSRWFHARHLHEEGALTVISIEGAALYEPLIENDFFDADIRDLLDFTRHHNGLIFRYEDMVLEPLAFLRDFVKYTHLPVTREAMDTAIVMANFLHVISDEGVHNRSGAPFEALYTLPRDMLEKMNERFGELIVDMDYPLWPEDAPNIDLLPLQERDAQKRFMLSLAEQNGLRIEAIENHSRLLAELQMENGYRIDEIAQLRESLARQESFLAKLNMGSGIHLGEI